MVHRWWSNAIRLMTRLFAAAESLGSGHLELSIVVHVDPRAVKAFKEVSRWASGRRGVRVFQSVSVTRGGNSMLQATLEGFRLLLAAQVDGPPDMSILLSESHYLMRTPGQLYAELAF